MAQDMMMLPAEISAEGMKTVLEAHATGAQIYDCKANDQGALEWSFREPVANLVVDGKTVGHHYPGPSWQLTDGSSVQGKLAAKVPGKTEADIPWLKLDVVAHSGMGGLAGVTTVQRINTVGGVLKGACDMAGAQQAVPYSADYVFLSAQ
ncbi:MAG: DUF3455 domain-containing protein [Rhodobacteraceae bacterium]|nr:DUF3455 domain-containing protein [Paracoccaceae bacterium]